MRVKLKLPYIIYTLLMLCNLIFVHNTSALSYQGTANIGFTFNPTLSVSVSGDLIIPNLTPGSSADSNSITVSVATNTAYGYTLTSTVGSSNNGSIAGNNSRNLVNSVDNTKSFTSLDYGSSIVDKTNFNDNTWGYSYSQDSGTNWRAYNGLPLYSDTTKSAVLFSTYSPAHNTSLDFKIAAKAGSTQASGEYTNIINFYAVSVPEPPLLYDVVEDMTKGTLADNNVKLSDTITQANSGVYTYDPNIYGVASDASNDYPIYFYRGILDTDAGLGTYGSDGLADTWPNYVKLGNGTCWRIVRTTGSGGVKMIYNGLYGATTAGSCANATGKAGATTGGRFSSNYESIISAGYTFNNNYKTITEDTAYGALFGTNEDYSGNSTNSEIKNNLENWFANSMVIYESRLESSAGYCNDRSVYVSNVLIDDNYDISTPYVASSSDVAIYYFGARQRNDATAQFPSLTCPRNIVDLYTVIGSSNGNKQLSRPIALLTADEASFAGSGSSKPNNGSGYNSNSYLRSGAMFYLLSPHMRWKDGNVHGFCLHGNGYLDDSYLGIGTSPRPVISLMHHIQVTGGNGTATSPWTIE